MPRLRVAVLLSGGGRTLANLIAQQDDTALPIDIGLVLSSKPDAGGLDIARDAGIPTQVVDASEFTIPGRIGESIYRWREMSREVDQYILDGGFDLVCMAGYIAFYYIPEQLDGRVMNIHPSLIPAFCGTGMYGMRIHRAAIKSGVKVSGCTVHFVNNLYDSGPIILQRVCPVLDTDTPESLADRVFAEEIHAYPDAIRLFAEKRLTISAGRVLVSPPAI
ncbi:MAG: phosphoribosylglycinamide formyltransferase [Planctomycetota bacterium]|nr:phosphoribosylglycinamide formyltransferase [Planctomycetota bacterium]